MCVAGLGLLFHRSYSVGLCFYQDAALCRKVMASSPKCGEMHSGRPCACRLHCKLHSASRSCLAEGAVDRRDRRYTHRRLLVPDQIPFTGDMVIKIHIRSIWRVDSLRAIGKVCPVVNHVQLISPCVPAAEHRQSPERGEHRQGDRVSNLRAMT